MTFLQSTMVPLIGCDWTKSPLPIEQFFGTGFLISNAGHVMTARHVVEKAIASTEASGKRFAAVIKQDDGKSPLSAIAAVLDYEFAPDPYDAAVIHIPYQARTEFRIGKRDGNLWRDIATYGYPESAISQVAMNTGVSTMKLNMRANKGYIQREVEVGDLAIGKHPAGFELSFQIGPGMSGAPILLLEGGANVAIGLAVSSVRSETTDFEYTEVNDNGHHFTERKVKIEEFGFAHNLAGLYDWSPRILRGRPLHEAYLIE